MVVIEHQILVESEKETITDCFNLLEISPINIYIKTVKFCKVVPPQA